MELNKIYLGDNIEVLRTFPDNSIDSITALDESIGSRIIEMAKGFLINVNKDKENNYRL